MSVRTDVSESTRIIGGRRRAESSRVASLSMPLARRAAWAGLFGLAPFLGGAASLSGVVGVGGGDGVSPMATWWSRFAIAAAAAGGADEGPLGARAPLAADGPYCD